MKMMINSKPIKKIIFKRKERLEKKHSVIGLNVLNKPHNPPTRGPRSLQKTSDATFQNIFSYINLNKEGSRIPELILSDLPCYKKYYNIQPIPSTIIHENNEISRLLNIYQFLYDNGGIYLNKEIRTHPCLFIKNHEMILIDINLFSCEKNSPIMKNVLDEANEIAKQSDITKLFQSFYDLTKNAYHFNSSIRFLV